MRKLKASFAILITAAVIFLLDHPIGALPALGRLLDPMHGWAANAEPVKKSFNLEIVLQKIKAPVQVWFEDRMVPHIKASNDHDLYFTQGYIHAYFRLWQMDFQTRAAAGRISEVVGVKMIKDPKTGKEYNAVLDFDRKQRRKGMIYAAENSLKVMEADPRTKQMLDAYTAGINAYISSLHYQNYPIEYKLMGYKPEKWTNLKCALLLKYMADDLTGYTEDIPLTLLRDKLSKEDFDNLFPERIKGSIPVIPEETKFDTASMKIPDVPQRDIWSHLKTPNSKSSITNHKLQIANQPEGIGSNNWAISGALTSTGAPILCNDPHLGLNLPSLWFEMQLQTKDVNVYGVSLPGAPGIIIGFNDSISWGMTNNYRDVKDFYEIEEIDPEHYRFDGAAKNYAERSELIKIKGEPDFLEIVKYTIHGPIMYDENYPDPSQSKKKLAMCWMAHRATNELLSIYLINRAQNYFQFMDALQEFQCPAQNFAYADRAGNIAMIAQGQFINKWKDQGRFVMKGNTSATLWGKDIPMRENPHVLNPGQGYVASANQITTNGSYPYWYNGYFYDFRAWRINELLHDMQKPIASAHNMHMQQDVVSVLANRTIPFLVSNFDTVNNEQKKWWSVLNNGFSGLQADDPEATFFQTFWSFLYNNIWSDEFSSEGLFPSPERTMQLIIEDSASAFYDDIKTEKKETLRDIAQLSFRQTMDSLEKLKQQIGSLEWYQVKNTTLTHLAKLPAFSYDHLKIGGWGNTINAVKSNHGPSWRMIVEMGADSIRGLGVYPGGQSGNPGSPYYGTFIHHWVEGKYYDLLFLSHSSKPEGRIKYTWTIKPKK